MESRRAAYPPTGVVEVRGAELGPGDGEGEMGDGGVGDDSAVERGTRECPFSLSAGPALGFTSSTYDDAKSPSSACDGAILEIEGDGEWRMFGLHHAVRCGHCVVSWGRGEGVLKSTVKDDESQERKGKGRAGNENRRGGKREVVPGCAVQGRGGTNREGEKDGDASPNRVVSRGLARMEKNISLWGLSCPGTMSDGRTLVIRSDNVYLWDGQDREEEEGWLMRSESWSRCRLLWW